MTTWENPLPEDAIKAILGRHHDAMLMGAHARDRIVGINAGLPGGRRTSDLDLAIAVPSIDAFKDATSDLDQSGGTGMRFRVERVQVDLIPFGVGGRLRSPIEVVEGVQMDITGIDEAFATAERMPDPYQGLRIPTLQAMIVLKTVAWKMRWRETDKDAQDLYLLLGCVDEGIYEDRCYCDDLDRFDGDPRRVGAYLTGLDAARDLPRASAVCRDAWSSTRLVNAMLPTTSTEYELEALGQLLTDLAVGSRQH
ncbi:MAG TPA: hypothetical protein H9755_10290 [Candidatus Dietzia intestinigallinarum]|nr:hypothetical protein [Candidatus Dietzia intestinigallinarum]